MTDKKTIALYGLCSAHLAVMHYYILLTCRVEEATDLVLWADNLLGIAVDVAAVLALSLLPARGRLRPALFITAIVTLLWAFCNVLYSRFFHHYIPLSAIGQAGTLADGFMLQNVVEGLRWTDLVFAASAAAACWLYCSSPGQATTIRRRHLLAYWPAALLLADLVLHLLFCLATPGLRSAAYYRHRLFIRHLDLLHSSAEPNWASFHRGSVRQLLVPTLYHALTTTQLTAEQCAAIEKEYYDHTQRCTAARTQAKGKNIIFIIVESYLSATSELIVDGKEVTPFLNTLRHDSTVYYNGRLRPDISVGESSDGQFLYMAGLLPLRSDVTVTKAKYAELPGLPKILCQEGLIAESQMIIPTLPSMWEQEKMCQKYGFDHLYSSADYQEGKYWYLSDEQIFQYALEKNLTCQRPFLSVILTMTMHQPYTEPKDPQFTLADKRLTEKYRNYLSTCHYTDRQIKWYFEQLKKNGLYDNSIIVVAADHHAHPSLFDMGEEDLSTDIPLYIVGGGIDKEEAWQGPCHQLDVYTTLLDLIGTKNPWHGFGHTLLTPQYQPSVRAGLWTMSEQIVLGNYFSPKNSSRSTP